jgi:hypothetical protein
LTIQNQKSKWRDIAINSAMVFGSIGVTVLVLTLLLPQPMQHLFYTLFPPAFIQYRIGMGDIFAYQGHIITPLEDPYKVLAEYPLVWTVDGFRQPAQVAERYDVLAVGDSYTEASSVAVPFADVLAQESGLTVKNMGVRGYGPTEEALMMENLGVENPADYVVIQFFAGNDISNAETFMDESSYQLPAVVRPSMSETPLQSALWRFVPSDKPPVTLRYPVIGEANGRQFPLVFLEGMLWALTPSVDEFRNSQALNITANAWNRIDNASGDACVIVMYVPSKEQIYPPFVLPEYRESILDLSHRISLVPENGFFTLYEDPDLTYDEFLAGLNNLRDAIQERAEQEGFTFLDLTPYFEEAAQNGEELYYTYDTHANQNGNNLIGRVLAENIRNCVPRS